MSNMTKREKGLLIVGIVLIVFGVLIGIALIPIFLGIAMIYLAWRYTLSELRKSNKEANSKAANAEDETQKTY